MKVSIIGLGFVGGSMHKSFMEKNINVFVYDKYKNIGTLEECLDSDIMFLCLPTQYNESSKSYDLEPIHETCTSLSLLNYNGVVVLKSTLIPNTTHSLSKKYDLLKFIHNPEFLTAKTAYEDFHNQKHIVLGEVSKDGSNIVENFYKKFYPNAEISICTSTESESMKLFCNSFYSIKVQFFNELFLLCNSLNCDYNTIKDLMIKNNWINPMHTNVPGTDGKLSYGGYCFPKDTNALLECMKSNNSRHKILEASIHERNEMRDDNENIQHVMKVTH